jgi:hypothetical protein
MSNTTKSLIPTNSPSLSTEKRKPNTRPSSQGSQKRTSTQKRTNSNSKYAQKSRGKKFVKPAPKPRGPVNTYTSVCCSLPATKPAAASLIAGSKDRTGLGHFRCSGCKKSAKVTVSKFKAPEASVQTFSPELIAKAIVVEVPVVSQN